MGRDTGFAVMLYFDRSDTTMNEETDRRAQELFLERVRAGELTHNDLNAVKSLALLIEADDEVKKEQAILDDIEQESEE